MALTRALVTGASSGSGGRIADRLAERGSHLVLVGRCEAALADGGHAFASRHRGRVEPLAADVGGFTELPVEREDALDG